MSWSATAFGQMCPRLKGSSASPRMSVMREPSTLIANPHIASQRGHVRYAVRAEPGVGDMPAILSRKGCRGQCDASRTTSSLHAACWCWMLVLRAGSVCSTSMQHQHAACSPTEHPLVQSVLRPPAYPCTSSAKSAPHVRHLQSEEIGCRTPTHPTTG